jgi:hypothetical protein
VLELELELDEPPYELLELEERDVSAVAAVAVLEVSAVAVLEVAAVAVLDVVPAVLSVVSWWCAAWCKCATA